MAFVGSLHATTLQTIYLFLSKSYSFVGFFVHSYLYVVFFETQKNLIIFSIIYNCQYINTIREVILLYSDVIQINGMYLAYMTTM
jgi:hypothetical protein